MNDGPFIIAELQAPVSGAGLAGLGTECGRPSSFLRALREAINEWLTSQNRPALPPPAQHSNPAPATCAPVSHPSLTLPTQNDVCYRDARALFKPRRGSSEACACCLVRACCLCAFDAHDMPQLLLCRRRAIRPRNDHFWWEALATTALAILAMGFGGLIGGLCMSLVGCGRQAGPRVPVDMKCH